MDNIKKLLSEINVVKEKYDKQREENRFNIFTALHKEHDEVNLHSRFISYLLSPNSGHNFKNKFADIFVREILKLNQDDFNLSNYEVIPNEYKKSEYKEIDILIINKSMKQAIIIENKIFAKDSNREYDDKKEDGYDGQLERYYNTIKTGIDKDGKNIYDFKCNKVFVFYLTMFEEKQPSSESIGKLNSDEIKVIYYAKEIKDWLEKCESIIEESSSLKEFVKQYLNLINKMTHNDSSIDERKDLKNEIANNWRIAKYLIDNFKHIKWHTVNEFWIELKNRLEKHYKNVDFFTEDNDEFIKTITKITHLNKDINHGVLFNLDEEIRAYVSGLGKLSWGILDTEKKWMNFKHETLENIIFSNFSTENTYRLIDIKNIEHAVERILKEILEEQKDNFRNMRID